MRYLQIYSYATIFLVKQNTLADTAVAHTGSKTRLWKIKLGARQERVFLLSAQPRRGVPTNSSCCCLIVVAPELLSLLGIHQNYSHVLWRHDMTSCHVMSWSCHALKDRLIPTRTVVEKAFLPLWRHHYDVTGSRDVIVDVTIWLPLGTFYRLPIGSNSVSLIVVEIFSLKWRKDDMGALQMFVLKDL